MDLVDVVGQVGNDDSGAAPGEETDRLFKEVKVDLVPQVLDDSETHSVHLIGGDEIEDRFSQEDQGEENGETRRHGVDIQVEDIVDDLRKEPLLTAMSTSVLHEKLVHDRLDDHGGEHRKEGDHGHAEQSRYHTKAVRSQEAQKLSNILKQGLLYPHLPENREGRRDDTRKVVVRGGRKGADRLTVPPCVLPKTGYTNP